MLLGELGFKGLVPFTFLSILPCITFAQIHEEITRSFLGCGLMRNILWVFIRTERYCSFI